ncbi:hypothetical protein BSY238_2492 [Methyloversatilis sp. RAC08]|uniref:nucleotidyltransferase domain-containing protein n=1 Tax=Methyloversatilis sp. RAC08 TaxID=1842540 RepID=UPI0008586A77|nr:nucleotidyltransferase family protein [Methyloversatilis sp. RAC08]AOF80893.1 hypothetical protein BSY238_2492 [Methyloversatilis sp. RAC08]
MTSVREMQARHVSPVAKLMRWPAEAPQLDLRQWSILIGQARNGELLGQLRSRLAHAHMLDSVPAPARKHLEIAWQLSLRHREAVVWELKHIRNALAHLDLPVVILKGAAYCLSDNAAARGRVFNDVDIMVPATSIRQVEDSLVHAGWIPQITNEYDQRYYRRWMHEIPPLEHKSRGTVIDVHHTIVPPTSGIVPDPASLLAHSIQVDNTELPGFLVLSPEDMVLHSAAHLFFNEFYKGLRDLHDLHCLLDSFSGTAGFWARLLPRADELSLTVPLNDALHYCNMMFGTPIPDEVLHVLPSRRQSGLSGSPRAWVLDQMFLPDHPSTSSPGVKAARWMAFVRSHWLRMPIHLLLFHLISKSLRRDTA